MKITSSFFSQAGPEHENQDTILNNFQFSRGVAFAVADGIGGSPAGDIASQTAVKCLSKSLRENPEVAISAHFENIKNRLEDAALENPRLDGMGTTLTVCIFDSGFAQVGHVGDSRIYHLRNEGILDRTKDQTELQHLIDQGTISKERAKRYPRKNVLLSAMSTNSEYSLYENNFEIVPADRIVLCSDGVYELVPRKVIRDFSLSSQSTKQLALKVQAEIERKGAGDDYSAIFIEVEA